MVGELRKHIAQKLNLEPDTFKLVVSSPHKTELVDALTLADSLLYNGCKIIVEKLGVTIKFIRFEPNNKEAQIDRLFSLSLPGKMTVKEVKVEVYKHFQKLQESEETKRKDGFVLTKPENLRLRRMFISSPDRIWMDTELVRDITRINNEIAVQNLPEGQSEIKTNSEMAIIFIQQFHPDTFTLGERIEFDTRDEETLVEFKRKLASFTKVINLGWASAEGWDGLKLLNITQLKWFNGTEDDFLNKTVHSLGLSDGDLLFYKDTTVPQKELTEDEKKQIQIEEARQEASQKSAYHRKEEHFKITIQDVGIDD